MDEKDDDCEKTFRILVERLPLLEASESERMKMIYEEGNYYHIYNRGCNKEKIFFCSENYGYLIRRMKKYQKEYFVNIIAFCLMPNHFHFLLQQKSSIPLSDWLRVLFSGYTLAVNKQQNRIGTLFEGKLKKRMIKPVTLLSPEACNQKKTR